MADKRKNYTVGRQVETYDRKGTKIEGYVTRINYEEQSVTIENNGHELKLDKIKTRQVGGNPPKDIAVVFD